MSLKIEYRNTLGSIINIQQKNNLEDYYELKFVDNVLKIKFLFYDKKIVEGTYFMSLDENINTVIGTLDSSHRWVIMSDKEMINGYTVWKRNFVTNNVLSAVFDKVVYDSKSRKIAGIGYDANGMPTRGGSKTFYFGGRNIIFDEDDIDGVFDDDAEVIFYFDVDGTIRIDTTTNVFIKPYVSLSKFLEEQQNGPILNLMTSEMITYFTNFQPLVPTF
ncbi:hypothetical protein [Flavobacterium daejeonense]|uniref:hypothetical protein n=1 Tax=Flavobacterium daejeonense TaxID=350893 RepID=UPI00047E42EF|nr:hypothetical protein [Flavobacterium daejeonense]